MLDRFYRVHGKRWLDATLAACALVALCPCLIACAAAVAIALGRPVLFSQRRPGLGGRPFRLVKFRTMSEARGADGELLPDAVRLGRLGAWLRATSLDELPELWNVLRGDMSLVGPRPLLMRYLERYSPEQARRHEVLPGITGWAQVNGRNALRWEDRFACDVWYVDNLSLRLDLAILGRTVGKTLAREGVSQPGHATSEEFLGDSGASDAARH